MDLTYETEWCVEWEDGTIWFPLWIPEAGSLTTDHPSGEAIHTFAPHGNAEPFAIEWNPEWMA